MLRRPQETYLPLHGRDRRFPTCANSCPYFDQYARAAQSRRGHGPLIVELPGLVVQSAGHQRSFSGRAWLPQEMPQGTRAEKLP